MQKKNYNNVEPIIFFKNKFNDETKNPIPVTGKNYT